MTEMTTNPVDQDFLVSDVKIAECRRHSDQLDYFAHSYCKLYGDWREAQARLTTLRERQPLLLVVIALVLTCALGAVAVLGGSGSGLGLIFIIGAAFAAYLVIDQTRREEARFDEIRRAKENFSASLFLAGVDLSLPLLEETLVRTPDGAWILGARFNEWRMTQLNSVFYRVFGVIVPNEVIERVCSRKH